MKNTIIVLTISFLCACSGHAASEKNSETAVIKVDIDNALHIDLKTSQWKTPPITLDNDDECLLGMVNDVLAFDSVFFVRSSDRLMKFDYSGKFLEKISNKGQAGDEYVGISSIWHRDNLLYLHDMNGSKVLVYDFDNTLKSKFPLHWDDARPYSFQMLIPFQKGYVGKSTFNGTPDAVTPELAYYNDSCSFLQVIGNGQIRSGMSMGYSFSQYNETVLYWRQFDNFIYAIDKSLTMTEKYYIDFGKKNLPLESENLKDEYEIVQFWSSHIGRYASLLQHVNESDRYVIFCFIFDARYVEVFDKKTNTSNSFYFSDGDRAIDIRPVSADKIMIFSTSSDDSDNGIVYTIGVEELVKLSPSQ